jgi:hypothetical protein
MAQRPGPACKAIADCGLRRGVWQRVVPRTPPGYVGRRAPPTSIYPAPRSNSLSLFDYLVYSAVTGEQVGVLRQSAPVSWVLWHTRLINLPVDSVVVMDLVAGKRLFALPVLSEATLTYSESVPPPPPRARP